MPSLSFGTPSTKAKYFLIILRFKNWSFKNKKALARAALFYNYQIIPESKKILETFYEPDFDFKNTLILEKNPQINLQKGQGSAEIIKYSPNKVEIKAQTDKPALLFLADNFYPSWEAKVNGQKSEIYRSDYTFKSVVVPAGESIVEFQMRWF